MPEHPDRERILNPLLANDRTTVQAVFDDCFPAILQLVVRHGGQRQDAEDVFMNSLEVLYLLAQKPDFQLTSAFSTLLYGISRLQWLKICQKKNRHTNGTISAETGLTEAADWDEALLQAERYQLYREKFALLGAGCQQILLLSLQKIPIATIARTMGFASEAYARKRKHLCKEKLIRLIRADRRYAELTHDQ